MKRPISVTIFGASGYTGVGLYGLCLRHEGIRIAALSADRHAGERLSAVFPRMSGATDRELVSVDAAISQSEDVAFLCLPHEAAMEITPSLLGKGCVVIDLSADFRMDTPESYAEWYRVRHTAPDLLREKVYGLPEFHRDAIRGARLISVPGCYPTSVQIGLAPLLLNKLANPTTIVIDAKSGVSGAGRKLSQRTHYVETNENLAPYSVGRAHRHVGEIEQELGKFAGEPARVIFSPHLTPMNQGILSTMYVDLTSGLGTAELLDVYRDAYAGERFVRVLEHPPETAFVQNTNYADVSVQVVQGTGRAIAFGAIDNLVKGAYGQALQCMNVVCGFDESEGLPV
jgi:N-acetyl-gamma-glutamyl-phosphate reductase